MKLQQLKMSYKHLCPSRPLALTLTGLLLLAATVSAIASASTIGLFGVEACAAPVSAQSFQEELQIKLGENGFTPNEAQRAAGTFGIAVENAALSGEYILKLKAQDGTVVKEVQVQKGSAAWTVTLSPGEYTLTEASHPQWLCRITVQ